MIFSSLGILRLSSASSSPKSQNCPSLSFWLSLPFLLFKVKDLNASFISDASNSRVQYAYSALHSLHCQLPNILFCEQGRGQNFESWERDVEGNFAITSRFSPLSATRSETPYLIPASFSIQLKRDKLDKALKNNRRLLNTEKIIFKTDNNQDETYVLVSVEPEGFVAIPHVAERQLIVYNIVCDELLFGIPHKAWWVVLLALLCLGIAFMIPSFLPSYLLPKNQSSRTDDHDVSRSLLDVLPSKTK
ncbi:hypothetical protein L6164_024089 [Bauhinia variegata]|uniref:Uncharacterized protein n=1 Tax=Bauhinia variegata TaxID=167791 RepID=A0ACB9LWG0_BAUVA|nr:hypothetical protein L6164_024089 [Bauhinia variegata]